mmetsp:Transcript_21554/g.37892  ORF Transcript_21554/g.37892 Transcript_21554/m.37892 type:complete len:333 (-) Transcript_21554:126-1124(-)
MFSITDLLVGPSGSQSASNSPPSLASSPLQGKPDMRCSGNIDMSIGPSRRNHHSNSDKKKKKKNTDKEVHHSQHGSNHSHNSNHFPPPLALLESYSSSFTNSFSEQQHRGQKQPQQQEEQRPQRPRRRRTKRSVLPTTASHKHTTTMLDERAQSHCKENLSNSNGSLSSNSASPRFFLSRIGKRRASTTSVGMSNAITNNNNSNSHSITTLTTATTDDSTTTEITPEQMGLRIMEQDGGIETCYYCDNNDRIEMDHLEEEKNDHNNNVPMNVSLDNPPQGNEDDENDDDDDDDDWDDSWAGSSMYFVNNECTVLEFSQEELINTASISSSSC